MYKTLFKFNNIHSKLYLQTKYRKSNGQTEPLPLKSFSTTPSFPKALRACQCYMNAIKWIQISHFPLETFVPIDTLSANEKQFYPTTIVWLRIQTGPQTVFRLKMYGS